MSRNAQAPRPMPAVYAHPFTCPSEAWSWGLNGWLARMEGARCRAGLALIPRPCEPGDVVRAAWRLAREGRIAHRELAVLVDYGRVAMRPDPTRPAQAAAAHLYERAMRVLEAVLRAKGIVQ